MYIMESNKIDGSVDSEVKVNIDGKSNVVEYLSGPPADIQGMRFDNLGYFKTSADTLSVKEFLARPYPLYNYTGVGATTTFTPENVLADFLNLPSVQEKTNHMKVLTGNLKVRVALTSTPYATGHFCLSTWMNPIDGLTISHDALALNALSKTHIVLDVATANQACLMIPLHIKYPVVSTNPSAPEDELYIAFSTITNISSPNTGLDETWSAILYVSIEDAEIAVADPFSFTSKKISKNIHSENGIISYPASIVAMIGKKLSDVPHIGRMAYATAIAADGVGKIAALFGWSKPRIDNIYNYPHSENLGTYNGGIRSKTLALDEEQEVPISADQTGESGDNLTYENIIGRYGIVRYGTISNLDTVGTTILRLPVDPANALLFDSLVWVSSPVAYMSQMFQLWRGSLTYKFVFCGNKFTRGKFRIIWAPSDTLTSFDLARQNGQSVLVDLSTETEVEITIPWGKQRPFNPITLYNSNNTSAASNGTLYLMTEEPLLTQSLDYVLSYLVYVKAGPDFSFQIPDGKKLQWINREWPTLGVSTRRTIPVETLANTTILPATTEIFPGWNDWFQFTMYKGTSETAEPVRRHIVFENGLASDTPHILHMGESTNTFRTWLKRFYHHFRMDNATVNGALVSFTVPYLPSDETFEGTTWTGYANTPLRHIANLFAGVKGTIRYTFVPLYPFSAAPSQYVTINRTFGNAYTLYNSTTSTVFIDRYEAERASGFAQYQAHLGEPIIVDIPYQNVSSWFPTRLIAAGAKQFCAQISANGSFTAFKVAVAAGEDFSTQIWNGVPMTVKYERGCLT